MIDVQFPDATRPESPAPRQASALSGAMDGAPFDLADGALDFAFQPIVNGSNGQSVGYEALLRHQQSLGFEDPRDFFDYCHGQGLLEAVQLRLWAKAVARFAELPRGRGCRLFLNLDARGLPAAERLAGHLKALLARHEVTDSAVTLELCLPPGGAALDDAALRWLRVLRRQGWKLALDRYGAPAVGNRLLHQVEPDLLKVDSYFVQGVGADNRKKLILSHMVAVAHMLGMAVVAVGVENELDFLTCREIGCDLMQGFMIEPPRLDLTGMPPGYAHIESLARHDRRGRGMDRKLILDQLERIPALPIDAEVTAVFERLRSDTRQTFVPIVDLLGQPLGIVREANIKNYAYSPFGKDLISNKGLGRKLRDFIVRLPIADIHMPVENIMSIYSGEEEAEGLMLVEDMRYVGFFSARSIIRVINEKNLAQARDQNPLSKLPGNASINQFVNAALQEADQGCVFAYVDFDNFKPFNDKYGFRLGDRAILLFAELMQKQVPPGHFLGHIGGDDFFIGLKGMALDQAEPLMAGLLGHFRHDAESFYDPADRAAGFIVSTDRDGNAKRFPLLTASAALVEAPPRHAPCTVDEISARIALLKKPAKQSPAKLASASL